VVKNTLAKRSLKGTPAEALEEYFDGPTALAISRESENLSASILVKFAEEYQAPALKAGVVGGQVIDASGVLALAKLPSRKELMSHLLGGIKSPGNRLVSVLQGPLRNLLYALNAVVEKGQHAPARAAEEEPAEERPAEAPDRAPEQSGQGESVQSESSE
jgi:large subunit ribosomal protein L10